MARKQLNCTEEQFFGAMMVMWGPPATSSRDDPYSFIGGSARWDRGITAWMTQHEDGRAWLHFVVQFGEAKSRAVQLYGKYARWYLDQEKKSVTDVADLQATWARLQDIGAVFLNGTKQRAISERAEMWESMCKEHKKKNGLKTSDGVWYYKTKRFTDKKNHVYLLWRGEPAVIIARAIAELAYMYDHLPNAKFTLLVRRADMTEHVLPEYAQ